MRVALRMLALAAAWGTAALVLGGGGSAEAQNYPSGGAWHIGAFGQNTAIEFGIARAGYAADTSPNGWGGGLAAGYDLKLGQYWLVGLEADGALDSGHSHADSNRYFNSDFLATGRGRLGFIPVQSLLIYGTAGIALHGTEYHGLGGTGQSPTHQQTTLAGFVYGGGGEYDVGGYTFFGEYLNASFDTWGFIAPDNNARYRISDSANVFRLGVKVKIGYDDDADIYRRDARRY